MLNTVNKQASMPVKFAVSALTMSIMLSTLVPLSAQADDLEIYQPSQTGGRKTLVLMLDTSGTMNGNQKLRDLKAGMLDFLQNAPLKADGTVDTVKQTQLENTWIGLGHYNAADEGNNAVASITVPAAQLGPIGSAQRTAMINKINAISGGGNTPSVNGFVEAAAYMLGTLTARATTPVVSGGKTTYTLTDNSGATSGESGFNASVDTVKVLGDSPHYISPLPAVADRLSCDGQGIYFLSGGQSNSSGTDAMSNIMANALGNTTYSSSATPTQKSTFCPSYTNLPGFYASQDSTSWNCMAQFAKTLYDRNTNPQGISLKTAFVGFGSDFAGITTGGASTDALNACHLGSRLKKGTNAASLQSCAVDSTTNANPPGGYGNGGFYYVNDPATMRQSVVDFIDNLGSDTVVPLVTGAPTIPVDDLNPNGFQPYGYMRMLQPNPAKTRDLLWQGNLKKYNLSNGAMVSRGSTTTYVLDTNGNLASNTTDEWNPNSSEADGGIIDKGGAYPNVPMPTTTTATSYRPLFTDVASATTTALTGIANCTSSTGQSCNQLTQVKPATEPTATSTLNTLLPAMFSSSGVAPMKNMSLLQKKRLINYLGFDLALDNTTAIPSPLVGPPDSRFLSMGGSVHAQPVQLSYSAPIISGAVSNTGRVESVLYGSMEGALHLVNATTGVEQMAFVPKEILETTTLGNALRVGESDTATTPNTPSQGVDGPWVADPAYKTIKASGSTSAKLVATRMNVYGGLRMGGASYYGLDLITKTDDAVTPKLLFRIDNTPPYGRLGQSWSKPVLANVRVGNVITRVMIIGGGYDSQYENPAYIPTTTAPAAGNAVYMVNAYTGALVWKADATVNSAMIHSIPARVSPVDRDGDGLIDSIYFADLGGQVFRADVNNKYYTTADATKFPVRVTRLADLATDTQKTLGTNPRFYEAPTVTVHDAGATTFGLVTVASGNRSSPLDVLAVSAGGKGLRTLPVNKVFGIIDRDLARPDLINLNTSGVAVNSDGTNFTSRTVNRRLTDLQQDPQVNLTGIIATSFVPATTTTKDGWYRSLSSNSAGTELADGTFRYPGGMKAYEEQIALTGKLYVPVYDPQGDGVPPGDPCNARVVGETDLQTYCLPYGVCLVKTGSLAGTKVAASLETSGAQFVLNAAGTKNINDKVIGPGIRGISLGDNGTGTTGTNACKGFTIIGNQAGTGSWNCKRKLVQTLWYEKQPNSNRVQ